MLYSQLANQVLLTICDTANGANYSGTDDSFHHLITYTQNGVQKTYDTSNLWGGGRVAFYGCVVRADKNTDVILTTKSGTSSAYWGWSYKSGGASDGRSYGWAKTMKFTISDDMQVSIRSTYGDSRYYQEVLTSCYVTLTKVN